MKKILPLLALVLAAPAACAPDIAEDPAPTSDAITVQFDPGATVPVVPLPNDLAIDPVTKKVNAPTLPTDSAAQAQFTKEYLNTLDGFPFESTASALVSGELNPATVTAANVLVFDVTDPAKPAPVVAAPTYANKTVSIAPPTGGWTRAHRYAVAFIGGPNGLRGANNQAVVGSQTWGLVSTRNSLVTCTDLASPDCRPAVDILPSKEIDPGARLADQTKTALQLEQIRRGYSPILKALEAPPLSKDRSIVPIVWTFGIVNAAEVTFDPADRVIPFPNDAVRTGPGGTVALPNPKTGKPLAAADCQTTDTSILLVCGLNTLDGFSTLVSPISENSDTLGAVEQGSIDAKSLDTKSVGLVALASTAPAAEKTTPSFTPCLNCVSSPNAAGAPQTSPQQLQWKLNAPLDEKTTYFGYVTTAVKDDKGTAVVANPVFALLRSRTPLADAQGKALVSILSDAQAKQLEPLRAAFAPAFDGLEKAGVPRASLALGFPFTTQSEASTLDKLYQVPAAAKAAGLPDFPIALVDATALYTAAAEAVGIPITAIGKFWGGAMLSTVLVTGPGGTLNPAGAKPQVVKFAMAVPATPPPVGGYPVTIFGHGFTRSRNDFLPIANALAAAGQVVIATDVLFHGERTTCTGSSAATGAMTDDAACANPAAVKCDGGSYTSKASFGQGLCVLRDASMRDACAPSALDPLGDGVCAAAGQGRCASDGKCQGAAADLLRDASGKPVVSGWNIFSLTNFFATRDNFRQQVVDLSQLVALLKSPDPKKLANQVAAKGGAPFAFDTTKIGYVGQSLGGILGTLFNSVSPDTSNVVLNVPGGALVTIILNAPSFAKQKAALLSVLAAQGLQPGTPAFDQFLGIAQWILDAADPANMGYRLTHPVDTGGGTLAPPAARKALIQFIEGDETVPNISNFALVAGANRTFNPAAPPSFGCVAPLFCYEFTEKLDGFDKTSAPTANRHGFLLAPPTATAGGLAVTTKAQTQAATFLATGALPPP